MSIAEITADKPMPFWQTTACPAWCIEAHRDADAPDERLHVGDSAAVSLSLEQADEFSPCTGYPRKTWRAPRLMPALLQHVRESEPVVEFHDERDIYLVKLTLAEAEQLAHGLLALVERGRGRGALGEGAR